MTSADNGVILNAEFSIDDDDWDSSISTAKRESSRSPSKYEKLNTVDETEEELLDNGSIQKQRAQSSPTSVIIAGERKMRYSKNSPKFEAIKDIDSGYEDIPADINLTNNISERNNNSTDGRLIIRSESDLENLLQKDLMSANSNRRSKCTWERIERLPRRQRIILIILTSLLLLLFYVFSILLIVKTMVGF